MRYVKYIGTAHQRQITAAEWRTVGITADTVVWSAHNGFAVPLDHFTDAQIQKAFEPDEFFVITGADEDFEPQTRQENMTPSQLHDVYEQSSDVLDLLNGDSNPSEDVSTRVKEPAGDIPHDDVHVADVLPTDSADVPTRGKNR